MNLTRFLKKINAKIKNRKPKMAIQGFTGTFGNEMKPKEKREMEKIIKDINTLISGNID